MPWCKHCRENCPTIRDEDRGYVCCQGCGRVVDQDIYFSGVTFVKSSSGQSQLAGTFIRSVQSEYSLSHERTLMKGRDEISGIVMHLSVAGGDSIIDQAHVFYKIAVERNFTRGRSTSQVAAACLYIACRQNNKPYLLIDFSDYLRINVYVLGAVFLQLCQLLRLEEHPIVQKPVDPSLFIHRFAERLLGEKNSDVIKIALMIIASMKRDWLQTGRKPSGLCGAALYIAALSQGLKYSKSDVVNVVYVCEATLTKRLIEFENTKSGGLTIEEFLVWADEEREQNHFPEHARKSSQITELLCEHKNRGGVHFAHGLCKDCYDEFNEISGGIQGGSEPPAFQRAEIKRLEMAAAEEKRNQRQRDKRDKCGMDDASFSKGFGKSESLSGSQFTDKISDPPFKAFDEAGEEESLSDIDDFEVSGYLHNEEEKNLKKIIWEKMNKEFLEEQAAKEAAAAAAKEAYEAAFANCSDDVRAAQELAVAAAEDAARTRKEKRQKRAEEAKNAPPPQNAAEATREMLKRKTFSSKINYAALDALFSDGGGAKKQDVKQDDDKQDKNDKNENGDDDDDGDGKSKMDDSATTDHLKEHPVEQEAYDGGEYIPGDYEDGYNEAENGDFDFDFY